ncbi:ATP-binding protein [Rudaea sp.]|uniref:sensor histidine kinase n=1 Tax=Rudaea sp. TaxID=2136325 RepID=UPI0032207A0D
MNSAVQAAAALPSASASATPVRPLAGDAELRVAALAQWLEPLAPTTPVLAVGERFLDAASAPWLSLPVVDDGVPVGSVSRYELMQRVYIKPFGRELYGRRAVTSVMHAQPLVIPAEATIEQASRTIAARIRQPIMEDFIVVDADGRYAGMGKVLAVLGAMERRMAAHSHELERANRQLRSSQAQLVQSEKMASLGQMVAGIAHEINTPLGYVRNNVDMTRESLGDVRGLIGAYEQVVGFFADGGDETQLSARLLELDARRAKFDAAALDDLAGLLDDTVFGVDQISELVGNLKDFSRLDQAHVARVDVHQLIESALKIGGNLLRKKNIEVVRQFGTVPEIVCSPAQINQVLLNLISNAAQAIGHGQGRIGVRTHAVGRYLLIAVEDNGSGIPAEHLARIFDPFFTTKPVGQGTGLGLSICYQIIEQHRGRIRAVSTPGAGTRFFIALPVRGNAEAAA